MAGTDNSDGSSPTGGDILIRRNEATWAKQSLPTLNDILIIEDDELDSERLQATIHIVLGRDVKVRTAPTLTSALDCVLETQPDMVFLDDYLKPNDTALQTLPLIKRAGYEGPIVVISGAITRRRVAELKAAGASACIHKEEVDSGSVTEALNEVFQFAAEEPDPSAT
ncbi:MAG: response regulator [Pseudomonadota bacterium]